MDVDSLGTRAAQALDAATGGRACHLAIELVTAFDLVESQKQWMLFRGA